MSESLTVGVLRAFLLKHSPETEITFGSTKYTMRPLIYYRVKCRGDDLAQIELNEITDHMAPTSEIDCRTTTGELLKRLDVYRDSDYIEFGSSMDAVPLEFRSVTTVVSFNLEQNQEPDWGVR